MNKDTVFIVDDDEKILRILKLQLLHNDYNVITASNGTDAYEIYKKEYPEITLVLLDIMLPETDGLTLCRYFKKINPDVKIIMLSAKDKALDVILGLDTGADDYVRKPFMFDELLARIRANLRKTSSVETSASILQYRDLVINSDTFEVRRADTAVDLSKTEFDLLYYLVLNNNLVQSREHILDMVWGYHYFGSNNIVDVYIKYLRDKIDKEFDPKLIHTVRGRGYVVK